MPIFKNLGANISAAFAKTKLGKFFQNAGAAIKGFYKTLLDATARAFNEQVADPLFDVSKRIDAEVQKYKNPVTLRTWIKSYMTNNRYTGILIQGQMFFFDYVDPLTKDKMEFYDTNPLILSFGTYLAQTGNLIEYGINLHFLPMPVRKAFITDIFNAYKKQYKSKMYSNKPRSINEFTWEELQTFVDKYGIDFAVRSYIPERRGNTILIRYEDWGKGINLPSSKFVGITEKQLEARYKEHLAMHNK